MGCSLHANVCNVGVINLNSKICLEVHRKFVDVLDEIAEGHGGAVVGALRFQRIPLDLVAKRMNALTDFLPLKHPVKTAAEREIAAYKIFFKQLIR